MLGVRHGVFCLGCCWALMLVMLGTGVSSMRWMLALTGAMLVEKTAPQGFPVGGAVGGRAGPGRRRRPPPGRGGICGRSRRER